MSVMDTLVSRRTYRRFAQKAVPQDVVDDIVEAVRLSSCGANRQAVRLVVVNKPEAVAKVQPLVKWAAYLPPEQGTPKADELPTLYVAVVQDTSIPGDLATDTGIALANMTLDGLEAVLKRRFKTHCKKGVYTSYKVHLIRYADDFVITGASKELLQNEILPIVREFLHARGLTLSEEKTKITHIGKGFDFLGMGLHPL